MARIVRNISYLLEVQWNGTTWTNESTYLMSVSGAHELVKPSESVVNGQPIIGEHRVVLWNESNRFSDYYASSPLYTYTERGKYERTNVRLRVTIEGVQSYVFKGQIKRLEENFSQRTITMVCRDKLEWLKKRQSTAMVLNEPVHEVVARYLTLAGLQDGTDFVSVAYSVAHPGTPATIDYSTMIIPYTWLDDEPVWEEMATLVRSVGARIRVKSDGMVYMEMGWKWAIGSGTATTFTLSNVSDVTPSLYDKDHADEVVVEFAERRLGAASTSVWELPRAMRVYPGKTEVFEARYRWPVVVMEALSDYKLTDINGVDLSGSGASLSVQVYGQHAVLTLINNSSQVCVLPALELKGIPLLGLPSQQITEKDNALAYELRVEERNNFYIQTRVQAKTLVGVLRWINEERKRVFSISGIQGTPSYEPGARMGITAGNLTATAIVTKTTYQGKAGKEGSNFTQSLDLIEDEFALNLFIVGTSTFAQNKVYWH